MIKITLNGEEKTVSEGTSITELVAELDIKSKFFVVEINREVLQKEDYDSRKTADGDTIEIAGFFGGG